jgi:hypothetical protein
MEFHKSFELREHLLFHARRGMGKAYLFDSRQPKVDGPPMMDVEALAAQVHGKCFAS